MASHWCSQQFLLRGTCSCATLVGDGVENAELRLLLAVVDGSTLDPGMWQVVNSPFSEGRFPEVVLNFLVLARWIGKMNDLLSHSMRASDGGRDFHVVDLGNGTELGTMDSGGYMKAVYDEVEIIRKEMAHVKELLVKLQSANEESKTILKAAAMKALRERMDKDIEAVTKTARSIKQRLENLEKKNLANRRNPGYEEGTSNDRVCTSIINAERKKLKDLLEGFQILREKIMTDYKETVERRYFTVTGERADDATIEHIIDTGESETFLQRAIQEQGRGQILETIKEIQERHDAVKDIEKSLLELHEIFMDMAVLVDAQGAILNNIQQNVNNTRDHIDSGTRQLGQAKKHQRSSRKCMCIAIILLLIIIAIVVIPLVTTLKK